MPRSSAQEISQLLRAWSRGDEAALNQLMPLVYDELHRLAHRYMLKEDSGHTLQTTALVNEAYLRLVDAKKIDWKDRTHFIAISAKLMRRILVDFARTNRYEKRSGKLKRISLEEVPPTSHELNPDLVKLNDALIALSAFDPRKAQVVELRFFGGLSVEETAEVLKISGRTVKSDWMMAKAWLLGELRDQG